MLSSGILKTDSARHIKATPSSLVKPYSLRNLSSSVLPVLFFRHSLIIFFVAEKISSSLELSNSLIKYLAISLSEWNFAKFHSDKEIAKYLISEFDNSKEEEIFSATKKIISECRKNKTGRTLLDKFLSEYGLTNDEGVALMCLAESVLRIPDDNTKDELISEKITNSNWVDHINQADSLFVNAAALTNKLSA